MLGFWMRETAQLNYQTTCIALEKLAIVLYLQYLYLTLSKNIKKSMRVSPIQKRY